jgi:ATP-dependent DNA helicase RecG
MLQVADNGGQSAFLAPTEVLAVQHAQGIVAELDAMQAGLAMSANSERTAMSDGSAHTVHTTDAPGAPTTPTTPNSDSAPGARKSILQEFGESSVNVALLTGSMTLREKKRVLDEISSGRADIVIGTHALLSDKVNFKDLGLLVIDEQHRFGVKQRAILQSKAELEPHLLVMSATPIPRTLAMSIFSDLDLLTLDDMPKGRTPVKTYIVSEQNAAWVDRMFVRMKEELDAGGQAFVVVPRISKGDLDFSADDYSNFVFDLPSEEKDPHQAVKERFSALTTIDDMVNRIKEMPEFKDVPLVTLHGKMTPKDKQAAFEAFQKDDAKIMVATQVIEVGVNIPNATTMIIVDSEMFGLAALHQLRGRVGRSNKESICFLCTKTFDPQQNERLKAMTTSNNGFDLALWDLQIRGEGDITDYRQSGAKSNMKIIKVVRDQKVIIQAREEARELVEADPELAEYPELLHSVHSFAINNAPDFITSY